MNARWTARWLADQDPVVIEDAFGLDDALASAELASATTPLIVELRSPSGASLTLGLGLDVSVATFAASLDPPYLLSEGSEKQDAPMVFFREGHWSEFDGDSAIPSSVAREAVHEFFVTGTRPTCVRWREV